MYNFLQKVENIFFRIEACKLYTKFFISCSNRDVKISKIVN